MPSAEQLKQFLVGTVVPVVTGGGVTWLAGAEVLAVLHLTAGSAAAGISGVLVFGIGAGIAWLVQHNILKGLYTPAARAARAGVLPTNVFSSSLGRVGEPLRAEELAEAKGTSGERRR